MSKSYQVGIIGCGFWANYQIAAWKEIPEVNIVAVCDLDAQKIKVVVEKNNISRGYTDVSKMLNEEKLDFVDIISNPETHPELVYAAAEKNIPVICQKPIAVEFATAKKMVEMCRSLNVPFYVHENFRWQAPMQKIKEILDSREIGAPFKARIYFNSRYPVLKNQPSLAKLERMIIADLGVHLFDLVRFFFGEVKSIYCQTQQIAKDIKGEDVAISFIETQSGVHCTVELSWASYVQCDCFPQTLVSIEGTEGSINLSCDCQLVVVKHGGVENIAVKLPHYQWVHPDYAVVHSALVACNQDLLAAITGQRESGNRADLNLETLKLVYAAYQSAETGQVIRLKDYDQT